VLAGFKIVHAEIFDGLADVKNSYRLL